MPEMYIPAVKITPGCNLHPPKCIAVLLHGCFYFIIHHDKNEHNLELECLLSLDYCYVDTPIPLSKILNSSRLGTVTINIQKGEKQMIVRH